VDRVTDYINIGDEVKVKVLLIDDQGRIKLSRKAAMKELGLEDPEAVGARAEGGEEGGDQGGGGGDRGGDRGRGPGGGGRGGSGGGRGPRRG
jgi:polyribonucleotide nucleotidyltransferase